MKKELKKEYKQALDDCWEYHKDLIKGANPEIKKEDLNTYLLDFTTSEWEDVAFFSGYLRGLLEANKLIK